MSAADRRAVAAATFGTALEWYDFFLYGTAAALVFPAVFFPGDDPLTGILLSFAVYATGFLARPIGGLVTAWLGDRYGRRAPLTATILVMGLATACIGLLPSYAAVGALAPTLLVALRLVQGAATGGEFGGAVLLALEHAPAEKRGFRGGLLSSAVYAGLILGNLAFMLLVAVLDPQSFIDWGWRVPFLFSLVLVAVSVYLRRRVDETPEFVRLRERGGPSRHPIAETLRQPRNVLAVFLVRVGQNTTFYVIAVFCLGYATSVLELPSWVTLTALLAGAAVAAVLCPLWGALGQRVGAAVLIIGGLVGLGLLAVPLFLALDTGVAALIVGVVVIAIGVLNSAADGVQPSWFASLFDTRVRYTGITIGREAGAIVGGGLAPLAATALVAWAGHWWPVAALMVVAAALGVVGAFLARAPSGRPGAERPRASAARLQRASST